MSGADTNRFDALHDGEQKLLAESIRRIRQDRRLTLSLQCVESSSDLIFHIVHQPVRDDDDLAIKCLGIRLFNGICASLGLLLRGYYQVAASIQRDLLETTYLLDFLGLEEGKIAEWRQSSPEKLKKNFAPSTIRTALERRDKYHGKRTEAYDLLCQLAAHPTPIGFKMLQVDDTSAHCGPFLRNEVLEATLIELAKLATVASINCGYHFRAETKDDLLKQISALETQSVWREEFYGVSADLAEIERMKELARLVDQAD